MVLNPVKAKRFRKYALVGLLALAVVGLGFSVLTKNQAHSESLQKEEQSLVLNIPSMASAIGSFAVDGAGKVIPHSEADLGKTRVEFIFDLHCGGCRIVENGIKDKLNELRSNNEIQLYYTPVAFIKAQNGDLYSEKAASALVTVAENEPEKFVAFMEKLYSEFPNPYPNTGVDFDVIGEWAKEVGISDATVAKFSNGDYRLFARENVRNQEARSEVFTTGKISTPTVLIGGSLEENKVLKDLKKVEFKNSDIEATFMETYNSMKN